MTDFKTSKTKENLMRAFAGESQARNRYTFASQIAKKQKQSAIEAVFLFTANQEKEHAQIFYNHLKECAKENIQVDGNYPVDITDDLVELLKMAQKNEYEEHDTVYKSFGDIAKEEGFNKIANSFYMIAGIEKVHGDRFAYLAKLLEENKLFVSDKKEGWMCLNCGYIYEGESAPNVCPVCNHEQGYFVRLTFAPYSKL